MFPTKPYITCFSETAIADVKVCQTCKFKDICQDYGSKIQCRRFTKHA